jgi:GntR family transcriptional repressor for pyruvate dehydrogenase complex
MTTRSAPKKVARVAAARRAARPRSPAIRAPKLSHLVADALRTQIANGELAPGARLPAEAELLRQFGVSRPTLREALRVVESEGLIRLGRGARSGATVLGVSVDAAARYGELYLATQKTTLGEVHEVRLLLEPSLVASLASRRPAKLVRLLEDCVREQRDALDRADFVAAVRALNVFHRAMVDASENRALSLLAGIMEGIPAKVYPRFLQSGDTPAQRAFRERTKESVEAHAELLQIIARGEARKAETFWRSYMAETAEYLERTGLAGQQVQLPSPAY